MRRCSLSFSVVDFAWLETVWLFWTIPWGCLRKIMRSDEGYLLSFDVCCRPSPRLLHDQGSVNSTLSSATQLLFWVTSVRRAPAGMRRPVTAPADLGVIQGLPESYCTVRCCSNSWFPKMALVRLTDDKILQLGLNSTGFDARRAQSNRKPLLVDQGEEMSCF